MDFKPITGEKPEKQVGVDVISIRKVCAIIVTIMSL